MNRVSDSIHFTPGELKRYSRHLLLPGVGMAGQKKLKNARVLCVGTGGLGSPVGLYLAAAGVGTMGLIDFDKVDASNLQRQIVHGTKDIGRPKTASAKERLSDINPLITINTFDTRLTSQNALDIIQGYDIVVDGSDNFPTRYLVNDACVLLKKPNVYGAIFRFEGQASLFWAEQGACYRCLYPAPPPQEMMPSCAEAGVLGVLPGIIGTIQATEVLKWILGGGELLIDRLLLLDAWATRFREIKFKKDPDCPICSKNPSIKNLIDYEIFCKGATTTMQNSSEEITAIELRHQLDQKKNIQIIDVREQDEYDIARIPHAKLIPLGEILDRQNEINPNCLTVVHCHHGGRSSRAIKALKQNGFKGTLLNLQGGISAWSIEVDPSVPQY